MEVRAIFEAPGFDALVNTGYDGMHTIAGVVHDTVVRCLQSLRRKEAVEEYETTYNKRFNGRPWEATDSDMDAVKGALDNLVQHSDSKVLGYRFQGLFSPSRKAKAHPLHVFASSYGMYVLNHLQGVGASQLATYNQVLRACNMLQKKKWTAIEIQEVKAEGILAICMVEAYLPVNEMDAKLHALLHLPDRIVNSGPLWVTSMFTYESLCGKLARWGRFNRRNPEATIFRCFSDMEMGFLVFWEDEDAYALPAVKQFMKDCIEDTRYVISRDGVRPARHPSVSRAVNSGEDATAGLRAALHFFYLWTDEM